MKTNEIQLFFLLWQHIRLPTRALIGEAFFKHKGKRPLAWSSYEISCWESSHEGKRQWNWSQQFFSSFHNVQSCLITHNHSCIFRTVISPAAAYLNREPLDQKLYLYIYTYMSEFMLFLCSPNNSFWVVVLRKLTLGWFWQSTWLFLNQVTIRTKRDFQSDKWDTTSFLERVPAQMDQMCVHIHP